MGSNTNQSYEHRQNFENRHNNQQSYQNGHNCTGHGLGGTLTIILVLGLLWAIGSLMLGIFILAFGIPFFYLAGVMAGAVCLGGSAFAFISCVNIYMQKNHQLALVCCILGSVIAIFTGGIIAGVVGIIFAFLLSKEKYRFTS